MGVLPGGTLLGTVELGFTESELVLRTCRGLGLTETTGTVISKRGRVGGGGITAAGVMTSGEGVASLAGGEATALSGLSSGDDSSWGSSSSLSP